MYSSHLRSRPRRFRLQRLAHHFRPFWSCSLYGFVLCSGSQLHLCLYPALKWLKMLPPFLHASIRGHGLNPYAWQYMKNLILYCSIFWENTCFSMKLSSTFTRFFGALSRHAVETKAGYSTSFGSFYFLLEKSKSSSSPSHFHFTVFHFYCQIYRVHLRNRRFMILLTSIIVIFSRNFVLNFILQRLSIYWV